MGGMILVGYHRSSYPKLCQWIFICLRSHLDWPEIKSRPLQWEARN